MIFWRVLKYLFSAFTLFLFTCIFVILIIAGTEAGSRWAINRAIEFANTQENIYLSVETINGTFISEFNFEDIHLRLQNNDQGNENLTELKVEKLTIGWLIAGLFKKEISIQELLIENAILSLPGSSEDNQEATDYEQLISSIFTLPFPIALAHLNIDSALITIPTPVNTDEQNYQIKLDSTQAILNNNDFQVSRLNFEMDAIKLDISDFKLDKAFNISSVLDWNFSSREISYEGALTVNGALNSLNLDHQLTRPLNIASKGEITDLLNSDYDSSYPTFSLQHESSERPDFIAIPDFITATQISLLTEGTFQQVSINADANIETQDQGPLSVHLLADYTSDQLLISDFSVSNQLGELSSSGNLFFSPLLSMNAEWALALSDGADEILLPGNARLQDLNGQGSISVQQNEYDNGLSGELNILTLDGLANGYPVTANGSLQFQEEAITSMEFFFEQNTNLLKIDGSVSEAIDLVFDLTIQNFSTLIPDITGTVSAVGSVTGSTDAPIIQTELIAHSLNYSASEFPVSVTDINLQADISAENALLNLLIEGISLPENFPVHPSDLTLELNGLPEQHSFDLSILTEEGNLSATGSGAYINNEWSSSIKQGLLDSIYGRWVLQEAVAINLSPQATQVSNHCWTFNTFNSINTTNTTSNTTSNTIEFCADAALENTGNSHVNILLNDIPLSYLTRSNILNTVDNAGIQAYLVGKPSGLEQFQLSHNLYLPERSYIEGLANVDASLNKAANAEWGLNIEIEPNEITLGLVSATDSELTTQMPTIREFEISYDSINVQRQSGLWESELSLNIKHQDSSGLSLNGTVDSTLSLTQSGDIEALLDIDLPSLDWLESLIPDLHEPKGHLHGTVSVLGTTQRPLIESNLTLDSGSFALPLYGIAMNNVDISLASNNENNFQFSLFGNSGEGYISITGYLDTPFLESRSLLANIQGENFKALNLDDRTLTLNPNLEVNFSQQALDITGQLIVPEFIVSLATLSNGQSRVDVSRDAYVINTLADQDSSANTSIIEQLRAAPVTGQVEVILGDKVNFTGYGLDIKLEGGLNLEQAANRPLLAYGEVNITEGSYEIYGQHLQTESGQLLFLGNPSNPFVDLRAIREVQETTVGIQMNGVLNNLQGQLFSSPILPENEILAMLITGKSFSNTSNQEGNTMLAAIANLGIERGQGLTNVVQNKLGLDTFEVNSSDNLRDSSLGVGKYITPDIFMRYDVGLFDSDSVLSVLYSLSEHIRLEVEAGISQSIDLIYTIEK